MEISPFYTWRSNFSLGYPIGAPVKIINIGHYEDLRLWNNNFMLRSGANIYVSQILVQGRCGQYNWNQKTTIALSTFNFLYDRDLELVRIVAN